MITADAFSEKKKHAIGPFQNKAAYGGNNVCNTQVWYLKLLAKGLLLSMAACL